MKKVLGLVMMGLLVVMFSGCGGGSSSAAGAGGAGAAGAGAKGPFVQGSTVTAYKLNTNGTRSTTDINATVTTDDLGDYSFSGIPWSGATEIVISGNYFNENTGANSVTPVSLSAVVAIETGSTVSANVNIFTDLEASRIKYLMSTGSSFADAQTQARADIVNLFDLNITADTGLQDLNLTDGRQHSQGNAELLRVSAAVAVDPSILDGLRHGVEDGNMTNDSVGKGAFVRLGNIIDDDINMTVASSNLETDLNVTDAPDANDTTTPALWVDRSAGHAPVLDLIPDVSIDEDSGLHTITLHATDEDNDTLHYSASTSAGWSILGGSGSGVSGATINLVPKSNKNGVVTVTASVDDGTGLTATRTFTVTVNPVNDAPVAHDDVSTIAEDANVTINVVANDTDIDGDTLHVVSVGSASHGSVAIDGNSSVKYTPNSNFNGTDTFTYQVADPSGADANATVTVTVTPVNDAPVAHDDNATLDEDSGSHLIDVLANDTDVDTGDTLTIFSVTQPAHGSVTIGNGSLNLSYAPGLDFNGIDTFTYEAKDSGGLTSTATVTVTVNPVNDAPVANPSTINAIKNTQKSGTLSASDIDGNTLTYRLVSQSDANGTVNITANTGAFTYDPTTDFVGDASFTFSVNDGTVTSNTAIVTIHVTDRVINVTANDDNATTDEDSNTTIDVLANDTFTFDDNGTGDPKDGAIISAVSNPSQKGGTVTIVSNKIQYVPKPNYYGTDIFTYAAKSASGNENNATVTVTVTPVNDVPVISSISNISENEDSNDTNIALSATDDDNDTLTYSATSSDANIVTVSVSGTTLTVHPVLNANGSADVNVSVDDGNGGIDSTLFTVTLNSVNDAPVAGDGTFTTNQNDVLSGNVTATDVDGDLNASGYTLVTNVAKGDLNFYADGNFSFNPAGYFDNLPQDANETVWFTYTASDTNGSISNEANVTITVTGVNDVPRVNEGLNDVTVYVGDTIDETVGSVFSDVDDNTTLTYTATGLSGTGILLSTDGNFTGTVTATPGVYSVTVTATDEYGASVDDSFTVTVNYSAQASDVNNTAWVFSDGIKVVFYPTGQYDAVGVDRNESFWDDGAWDINDSMHAVQLVSSDGGTDYLYLSHAGPSAGDIVTDRFIDLNEPSDDRSTLLINKVIDIQGNIADLSHPSIVADDVNSTAIRIADGPTINLFSDSTYLMIDNADQNISRTYQRGTWAVAGGALILDNGDVNVTFSQSNIGEGTLGYHEEGSDSGLLTVRQVTDINKTNPITDSYDINASEISRKAMIFTDGNAMQFYEANATDGGDYWFKGRDEDGVVKDKGTYQVESNGTVTLASTLTAGDTSSLTFNSAPSEGTLIIVTYPDGSNDALVIRKIFGFGAAVDDSPYVSTGTGTFLNKSMQLTNGNTYSFYPDGILKMHGLSYDHQTYYDKQGTWDGSISSSMEIRYLDNSTDTFTFNDGELKKGTRVKWWSSSKAKHVYSIIKNVVDINTTHAIDTYPEYSYKAVDDTGATQSSSFTAYKVIPYADVDRPSGSTVLSIKASFYGNENYLTILKAYTSIVLKVFKTNGEYVGSFGPFNPNDVAEVAGYHDIGNHAFSE